MLRPTVVLALLVALFACGGGDMDVEQEREAIRTLWRQGNTALEADDWDAYGDLWAHTEYAQVIHSDEPEWLTGWDELAPNYRQLLAEGPAVRARTRDMRIRVAPRGEMAWAILKADLSLGESPGGDEVTVWETVVFEKLDGEWKLVHGHVSRPAGTEEGQ